MATKKQKQQVLNNSLSYFLGSGIVSFDKIPSVWKALFDDREYKFICYLVGEFSYYQRSGRLVDNKMFYCTVERAERMTRFNSDKQERAIKKLIEMDIGIVREFKGAPPKRWIVIDQAKLISWTEEMDADFFRKGDDENNDLVFKPRTNAGLNPARMRDSYIKHKKRKHKNSSSPRGSAAARRSAASRQFKELKKENNTPECDVNLAIDFKESLYKRGEKRNWKPAKEAHYLTKALENFEEKRKIKVLQWYFNQVATKKVGRGKKLPLWTHPKKITEGVFEWIEDVKESAQGSASEGSAANLVVKTLHKTIANYDWNNGAPKDLARTIETSLDNYTAFRDRLKELEEEYAPQDLGNGRRKVSSIHTAIEFLLQQLYSPKSFIKSWFAFVLNDTNEWRNWNGSLKIYTFEVESPKFRQYLDGRSSGLVESLKSIRKLL